MTPRAMLRSRGRAELARWRWRWKRKNETEPQKEKRKEKAGTRQSVPWFGGWSVPSRQAFQKSSRVQSARKEKEDRGTNRTPMQGRKSVRAWAAGRVVRQDDATLPR